MSYWYAQQTPIEEIDEMITILKAIQKHQREVYLLTVRARTMCPQLMDMTYHNPLHQLLDYKMANPTIESEIKTELERIEARKKEIEQAAKE